MINNDTYDMIMFMTALALVFLVITLIIGLASKSSRKRYDHYVSEHHELNEQIRAKRNQLQSLTAHPINQAASNHHKQRHEEVIDTLDWMMQNNIITPTEYNNLVVKSLPFLN